MRDILLRNYCEFSQTTNGLLLVHYKIHILKLDFFANNTKICVYLRSNSYLSMESMERTKLTERRKAKGFSQSLIAEKLCMDVSNYNRREKGQMKISLKEWEKLADVLQEPIENIYESDDLPVLICRDNSTGYNPETNLYSIPAYFLEIQRKYIEKLENEIRVLRARIDFC
jgi:transcriptional regulator with XRE-family HTH domain